MKSTLDSHTPGEVLLGIELKGWYLLSKEREPSFRFIATPAACAPADLIAIFPWYLSNVIAGSPVVLVPFMASARYIAEYRNHHWTCLRKTSEPRGICQPTGVGPYPKKPEEIADRPVSDSGRNFGRIARTGLLNKYVQTVERHEIAGIQARYWRDFLKLFQENEDHSRIADFLTKLGERLSSDTGSALVAELAEAMARVVHAHETPKP